MLYLSPEFLSEWVNTAETFLPPRELRALKEWINQQNVDSEAFFQRLECLDLPILPRQKVVKLRRMWRAEFCEEVKKDSPEPEPVFSRFQERPQKKPVRKVAPLFGPPDSPVVKLPDFDPRDFQRFKGAPESRPPLSKPAKPPDPHISMADPQKPIPTQPIPTKSDLAPIPKLGIISQHSDLNVKTSELSMNAGGLADKLEELQCRIQQLEGWMAERAPLLQNKQTGRLREKGDAEYWAKLAVSIVELFPDQKAAYVDLLYDVFPLEYYGIFRRLIQNHWTPSERKSLEPRLPPLSLY